MVVLKTLEDKILSIMSDKDKLEIYDLENNLSIYELMHLVVLKNEFSKILICNLDNKNRVNFNDDKLSASCPYFEIQRKG